MAPDHPICLACGSQHAKAQNGKNPPARCKICDDPRQFVPREGQQWTNLRKMKPKYRNVWSQDPDDPRIWWGWTEQKFGIGQRCFLLKTGEGGNILWDCITLLDADTTDFINSHGGIKCIVISHPHYWTTCLEWAKAFNCPVYLSKADEKWLCRPPESEEEGKLLRWIEGKAPGRREVVKGVAAVTAGGHFSGSLVLCWERYLFIADTIVTVPSAYTPSPRPTNSSQTSYAFMWAIPNMIPLSRDAITTIWKAIKDVDFDATFGAFVGMEVRGGAKERVRESMRFVLEKGHRGEGVSELAD